MKRNFTKNIFYFVVLAIVIFAIYKMYFNKNQVTQESVGEKKITEQEEIVKKFKIGVAQFDNINPILSTNKQVQEITKIIYEPMFNLNEEYKIQPCLATEFSTNEDKTIYVIKLRKDVTWSNGTKFSGEDVRYTIDRLKDTPSIYSSNVQYVTGVEVVDGYMLKITLSQQIDFFEYNLTFPIMCGSYYDGVAFNDQGKNVSPPSTGMFKIGQVGDTYISLEKNMSWWNISNKNSILEQININKYSSIGELYNDFRMGNLDVVNTTNTNYAEYIGTAGYKLYEYKGREYDGLVMNFSNDILNRAEVRNAIDEAIDRANILSTAYNVNGMHMNSPLDFGSWLFQGTDTIKERNMENAKKILEASGWQFSYGSWNKVENYRTIRLKFNLVVNNDTPGRGTVGDVVAAQLNEIGMQVNLIKANTAQYNTYLQNKNYDMILTGTNLSANPSLKYYLGENNISNYSNQEVNNILNDIKSITDENLLKEKYKRLNDIYIEQKPSISLYTNKVFMAYSNEISGTIKPTWYNIFNNIETWYKTK